MKRLIVDFLRRWWWAYLGGVLFVTMLDMLWASYGSDAHSGFALVVIFMLPLLLDQKRGHTGVAVALPVSQTHLGPFLLVCDCFVASAGRGGAFLLATGVSICFFSPPTFAIFVRSFSALVLGSLISAGASCCLFSILSPVVPENVNYFAYTWMLLWTVPIALFLFPNLLEITKQGPAVWLAAALLGSLLAGWSYLRLENLVIARAMVRRDESKSSSEEAARIPASKPGATRFGGAFFEVLWMGFLFGLVYPAILLPLGNRSGDNQFFWPGLFAIGTVGSTLFMPGGARLLRILPLSTGRLAFIALLMPLLWCFGALPERRFFSGLVRVTFLRMALSFIWFRRRARSGSHPVSTFALADKEPAL